LSANLITGPLGVKGAEALLTTNVIPRLGIENQLLDSNISDDGTKLTLNSDTQIIGQLNIGPDGVGSQLNVTGSIEASAGITGSLLSDGVIVNGTFVNNTPALAAGTERNFIDFPDYTSTQGGTYTLNHMFNQNYPAYGVRYESAFGMEMWDGYSYSYGSEFLLNGTGVSFLATPKDKVANSADGLIKVQDVGNGTTTANVNANRVGLYATDNSNTAVNIFYDNFSGSVGLQTRGSNQTIGQDPSDPTQTAYEVNANNIYFGQYDVFSAGGNSQITFGNIAFTKNINFNASGSVNINAGGELNITADVVCNNPTLFKSRVTADITTGGTTGAVSIDFSLGNFFTITPSGTTTISPSNVDSVKSQTISIVIDNTATQTVSFSGILWAAGTAPTITPGGKDIVTLVSFGSTVYGTAVQNLS